MRLHQLGSQERRWRVCCPNSSMQNNKGFSKSILLANVLGQPYLLLELRIAEPAITREWL